MNPDNYSQIMLFGKWVIDPPRGIDFTDSLSIRFYGIIIAVGMLLAVIYGCKRCKQFGISVDDLTDAVLALIPTAIIGARLYYCIFQWDQYKNDLISVLYIWEGGLAIYGGVIAAMLGAFIFCRIKKIKPLALLDLIALGLLIGQAIGRWGNFFNREAFGSETSGFWAMGLYNDKTGGWEYYHPTFFYESVWNAIGFVLLHFLSKKRKYDGQIVLGYVAWYGLGRAVIEGLRADSLYLDAAQTIRVSQWLAAVTCFLAVGVLLFMAFRRHDPMKMQVHIAASRVKIVQEERDSGMEPLILTPEEETPAEEVSEEAAPVEEAIEPVDEASPAEPDLEEIIFPEDPTQQDEPEEV